MIAGNRQSLIDVVTALSLPMPTDAPATEPLPFAQEIRLEDIAFRYPSGSGPVLDSVSLTVPKGARVGISGRTGAANPR